MTTTRLTENHPWLLAITRAGDVAESTKKQYLMNLQTLRTLAGSDASLEFVLTHPRDMLRVIIARYSNLQTRKALVAAVKAVFKYVPELNERYGDHKRTWHEAFQQLDRAIFGNVSTAEPSPRELENWVSWKAVQNKLRELSVTSYASTEHLLLSMYSMIEPLRADYGNVKLVRRPVMDDVKEGNFISLPPAQPQLTLNEYKTAGRYGQFRRDLPAALVDVISKSLETNPRQYLFVDESGRPYTNKNSYARFANRLLEKIFKKRFTIRMLRHSFISNIDFNETTPGQLMQHSHNMLHSIAQQQLYRRKVKEDPEPERAETGVIRVTRLETPSFRQQPERARTMMHGLRSVQNGRDSRPSDRGVRVDEHEPPSTTRSPSDVWVWI